MDLFSVGDEYTLAHCISADFALGKGIAAEFNRRFKLKSALKHDHYYYQMEWVRTGREHGCIYENGVLNLVTKERYFEKPTYESLEGALEDAKVECLLHNIRKIAMPKIGCGLDKLRWNRVRTIIFDVFEDTEIEIKVCYIDNE